LEEVLTALCFLDISLIARKVSGRLLSLHLCESETFQSWPVPSGGVYAGIIRHMRPTRDGNLLIHQSSTPKQHEPHPAGDHQGGRRDTIDHPRQGDASHGADAIPSQITICGLLGGARPRLMIPFDVSQPPLPFIRQAVSASS
jgi:hypothetical protein